MKKIGLESVSYKKKSFLFKTACLAFSIIIWIGVPLAFSETDPIPEPAVSGSISWMANPLYKKYLTSTGFQAYHETWTMPPPFTEITYYFNSSISAMVFENESGQKQGRVATEGHGVTYDFGAYSVPVARSSVRMNTYIWPEKNVGKKTPKEPVDIPYDLITSYFVRLDQYVGKCRASAGATVHYEEDYVGKSGWNPLAYPQLWWYPDSEFYGEDKEIHKVDDAYRVHLRSDHIGRIKMAAFGRIDSISGTNRTCGAYQVWIDPEIKVAHELITIVIDDYGNTEEVWADEMFSLKTNVGDLKSQKGMPWIPLLLLDE